MSGNTKVLNAYRELLKLIQRLPPEKRVQGLAEARSAMRAHAQEPDLMKQSELFKQLVARISFLRVITPRRPREVSSIGDGHYVLRDGVLVEGSGQTAGNRWVTAGGDGVLMVFFQETVCLSVYVTAWP
jgi:hypothetical protein